MKIGLIDVDSIYPNFALMKIAAYHKAKGDVVEWVNHFETYDKVYKSKIFTFSKDNDTVINATEIVKGGTGYDLTKRLPEEIENTNLLDYSIYPMCNFSLQFLSRGCIRSCDFCLVKSKEGDIKTVDPAMLNPNGEWVEVLDNNFFANPNWRNAIEYLHATGQKINLHGVDIRIMNEEQANALNTLKLKNRIHIAWDNPNIDLTDKLKEVIKYIKPYKLRCYVLVGFNSTIEQDLFRLETLKQLGIAPFVMPYRNYNTNTKLSQYVKDLAHWANRMPLFKSCEFKDFKPRKGFQCSEYFNNSI